MDGKHDKNITHDIVAKYIEKFKKTGSVTEQPRNGHPRTSTDEGGTDVVVGAFTRSSPKNSLRFGCRKQCQQMEYHAHFEKPQMSFILNASVAIFW
jgi:hypothetical protein